MGKDKMGQGRACNVKDASQAFATLHLQLGTEVTWYWGQADEYYIAKKNMQPVCTDRLLDSLYEEGFKKVWNLFKNF